ncbi:MAG: hypothetical protein QOJ68_375 [Blastococcus sp.]|jgi:hypothetical protein|nr:hypothetical protein [Blastococcus sp.]
MDEDRNGPQLELLRALVGTWTTEGAHPLLPDEAIHGEATFEWLDGDRFLIMRSHYDHPEIPDGITVTGVTDDQLSMHYFDSRGVHRIYSVGMTPGTWRFWLDAPGFSQRFTGTFSDDGTTITGRGQLSRDGGAWEDDLALTYRRTR